MVNRSAVEENEYYWNYPLTIDYHWILVVGIIIGAFASSVLSGTFAPGWVPPLFATTFSANPLVRWIVALIGGILLGFGGRLLYQRAWSFRDGTAFSNQYRNGLFLLFRRYRNRYDDFCTCREALTDV